VTRHFLLAASAILLFAAGAAALVAWLTRGSPIALDAPSAPASPDPMASGPPMAELPLEPVARERALEVNEARERFEGLRRGFPSAKRTPASEARLLPALDALFQGGAPRWALECRGLLCRLEVEAPASEWQEPFTRNREVRRNSDRVTFDPDGEHLAFVELVEGRVADGAERPEGEKILDALEGGLIGSDAARSCLAARPGTAGAEVRFMVDRSGVTYRFGAATDSSVAYCLMMEAMPDVVGAASAPAGVQRAERRVWLPAAR